MRGVADQRQPLSVPSPIERLVLSKALISAESPIQSAVRGSTLEFISLKATILAAGFGPHQRRALPFSAAGSLMDLRVSLLLGSCLR